MDKKTQLDKLHYEKDKQQGNLEIAFSFKDNNGNPKWSKWRKYLDVQGDNTFLEKVNNRTILQNEIVIDIEEPERFENILEQIKKDFQFYSAYFTGSKGNHIHLWFDEPLNSDEKKAIIHKYGADEQKATERCMIALENFPHWKTGKPKILIEGKEGLNNSKEVKAFAQSKKKQEEENKIKAFLQEERKKFESLGCGCINDTYYFGTKVFRDGQSFNAVITSDKKAYIDTKYLLGKEVFENKEIRNNFGLNFKDDFYDESLDNILSAKAIQRWLFEDVDSITIQSVYEKFIDILKKYLYLEDERKYSLVACYRIASFFMPIWKARARLFIFAEMGSAKSRLTQILHNTGFNSIALGDWTLPYLKTIIESTRGETHIDDFETLPEDLKNATIRLVKVGYMRGFKAGKMSDGNKRKPEVNDLFNTTSLNNTEGLDFISYDRCATIRIPKISKKEYDKEPNFDDAIWQELRDEMYILGLKYPHLVKETYEQIKSDKIRGRLFSIFKPELAIAKFISDKVYSDLEAFWIEETEQRNNVDFESDWEFLSFKQIYKLLSTLPTNATLSTQSTLSTTEYFTLLNDVVQPIGIELYNEDEFKKKKRSMSIVIGNILSRNPIFKKREVKGKKQYKVNFEEFKSLLQAKGYLKPIQDILEVVSGDSVDKEERVEYVDSVGGKTYQPTQKELLDSRNNKENTQKYCGNEFEEDGHSFLCGQLWKGNQRKYCSNCKKEEQFDFSDFDMGGEGNE